MSDPRILILRYSAIGDCIMTAWSVTALRSKFPEAKIVWAVQPRCATIVSTALAEVAVVPRERAHGQGKGLAGWRSQIAFAAQLRRQNFDVGFDFQGHAKTAVCLFLARPKIRLSMRGTDPFTGFLNSRCNIPTEIQHTVDRESAFVRHWTEHELPDRPMMPGIPSAVQDRKLVTIQTGSGAPNKSYPVALWRVVADKLTDEGFRVVALGGPADPIIPGVESMVGKLDLLESLSWVRASALHLAADTGTGHAAAAYGIPVVSIFGPMSPHRFRPYTDMGRVLQCGLDPAQVDPTDVAKAALKLYQEATLEKLLR